jgi:hypothetical protein
MQMRPVLALVMGLGLDQVAGAAHAGIISIGPFAGSLTETWESFPNYTVPVRPTLLPNPTAIMGGAAMISHPFMAVYEPTVSLAFFDLNTSGFAQVADGSKGIGSHSIASLSSSRTTTITFLSPISAFGAFWGALTGGGIGDPNTVVLDFFDVFGNPIGTDSFAYSHSSLGDGRLDWHGWQSSIPVGSLTYTGDFVAVDGLQADAVPEPGTLLLLGSGLASILALRQSHRS